MRGMRFLSPRWTYACIYLTAVISQVFCKTCPPLKSESVDIVCEFEGDIVDCGSPLIRGSTARLACKHSYKIPLAEDPGYRDLTCLSDGSWSHPLFNCIPECGTAVAHGTPLIINGQTATRGAFPWHIGIYQKNSKGSHVQICAGTLVSPSLVISAAHCFFDDTVRKLKDASNFAAAAGKYYRSYDTEEEFAEKSAIKKIDITERYLGYSRNFEHDIALVHLEKSFTITTLIRPVCMDWSNEYERDQLKGGSSGKIVGWGRTETGFASVELQEITLPFADYGNCISEVPEDFKGFVTADKFCAGLRNGSSLCDGDSGGGLCFQLNGRWYLRGVASVGPVNEVGMCAKNYYTAFTNVGRFLDWIRKILFNVGVHDRGQSQPAFESSTESCSIPEQPENGRFELRSCKDRCNIKPGSRVPIGSFLKYRCDEGYALSGIGVSFCYEEGWYEPPTCVEKIPEISCPALRSRTMNIDCNKNGKKVSCESTPTPGTKAKLACKEFYKISFADDPGYREITCLEDGKWDHPVFQCAPVCGTVWPDGVPVVVNGTTIKKDRFPWRVNIYRRNSTAPYSWVTDATLISPDLLITQASSILDQTIGQRIDVTEWAITVGDAYNSYATSEPYAQKSMVKSVDLAKGYNGVQGSFNHNLALIRVEKPFNITALVRPVCIDWTENVGYSKTESKDISRSYISSEKCRSQVIDAQKHIISEDTFCTDCNFVVNVCTDVGQGGSFICKSQGLWYLLGRYKRRPVVQNNTCQYFYAYMKLGSYLDWIRKAYDLSAV